MSHIISVITDETSITLGSKCYYRWDLCYPWVQMLIQMRPSLHLGPVITLVPSTTRQSESSDCGLCVVNQSNGRAMLGEHRVI